MNEKYMQRCIELAQNGLGHTAPNPMVGSVIVANNTIIGEGYHRKCGEAHAEVNAVNAVKNTNLLQESTIYVNLEPCSHFGRTPPCSNLIIEKKIPKVVIGCVDTFSEVSGRGIEQLQNAGCEVITGVLEPESKELNRSFFTFHKKKRPYVVLKWAQTADGFIDIYRTKDTAIEPLWITNETARLLVHKWRTEEDAIMVATNTVAKDNPKLNVRDCAGKNPIRITIDRNLRLSKSLSLFDGSIPTLVFTSKKVKNTLNIEYIQIDFESNMFLENMMNVLYNKEIQSIFIEGGSEFFNSIVKKKLWDEARVFTGDKIFGNGIKSPHFPFYPIKIEQFGNSNLRYYRNNLSV